MHINDKLRDLYFTNWDDLQIEAGKINNITHPLLIYLNEDEYLTSEVKVMVFGQETDGWHGKFPREDNALSVDELMKSYQKYFYSNRSSKRPFWNKSNFKHFETVITKYFKLQGKSTAFVWNNLSKIGKVSRGKSGPGIRSLELKYLDVIKKEVEILKPEIIIFTTGHSRDKYIERAFGKDSVEFEYPSLAFKGLPTSYIDKNNIAKIHLSEFPQITAIRVEHPNRRTTDNNLITDIIIDSF